MESGPESYTIEQALADLDAFAFLITVKGGVAEEAAYGLRLYLVHFQNYGLRPAWPGHALRHEQAVRKLCMASEPEVPKLATLGRWQRRHLTGCYQSALIVLAPGDYKAGDPWALLGTPLHMNAVQTELKALENDLRASDDD